MTGLFETLPGLMAPAFAALLLVAATHVPLGREVLKRGIIFLDLAVAQFAALGFIAASVVFHLEGIAAHLLALATAIGAACVFSSLEKRGQVNHEALIGCGYILAASCAMLLFANDPHGNEQINNLMAGQVLWTKWHDLILPACVYSIVIGAYFYAPEKTRKYFYPLFAICVTLSVQLIGVYLVFASLIIPALATQHQKITIGYAVALIAISTGLAFSALTDFPSGPILVCAYALAALGIKYLTAGYKIMKT